MKFVSFYTPKYKEEADKLMSSLDKFTDDFEVEPIKDLGSWQENTQYKAKFMLKKQEKWGNVCWLDADCIVRGSLKALYDIKEDVSFHRLNGSELLSGTLFFSESDAANLLIREWIKVNQEKPAVWDQKNLDEALKRCPFVTIHNLPPEYCFIFDISRKYHKDCTPIIEHFQASRKYK